MTNLTTTDVQQKRDRRAAGYMAAVAALKARIGSVAPARLAELTDFADLFAQHIDTTATKRTEYARMCGGVSDSAGTWRRQGRWRKNLVLASDLQARLWRRPTTTM